jgi:hypothetical protein
LNLNDERCEGIRTTTYLLKSTLNPLSQGVDIKIVAV